MTKYRIRWIPARGTYQVQAKVGILGWFTEGYNGPHGVDIDHEFTTQQEAIYYIDELYRPKPSTKPVVVWEGER